MNWEIGGRAIRRETGE